MPSSGPIRARNMRDNIRELGFENGVVVTMEAILDEHAHMRWQLQQLTELVDQCINQVVDMVTIGTDMKGRLETMKRINAQGDRHDC